MPLYAGDWRRIFRSRRTRPRAPTVRDAEHGVADSGGGRRLVDYSLNRRIDRDEDPPSKARPKFVRGPHDDTNREASTDSQPGRPTSDAQTAGNSPGATVRGEPICSQRDVNRIDIAARNTWGRFPRMAIAMGAEELSGTPHRLRSREYRRCDAVSNPIGPPSAPVISEIAPPIYRGAPSSRPVVELVRPPPPKKTAPEKPHRPFSSAARTASAAHFHQELLPLVCLPPPCL